MVTRTRWNSVLLAVLCSGACFAACGGDDDNDDDNGPTAGSGGAGNASGKGGTTSGKGGTTSGKGGTTSDAGDTGAGGDPGSAGAGGDPGSSAGASGAPAGGAGGAGPVWDLTCLGTALPGTIPATITIAGNVLDSVGGVVGAAVEARAVSDDTLLDSDTSIAAGGYALSLSTGTAPLDAYLSVSAATYLDTFVYPPIPFLEDLNTNLLLATDAQRTAAATAGTVTLEADTGLLYVFVVDCNGDFVEGATVTSNPAGDLRYVVGGVPSAAATSTDASGVALIFNLTPGDVEIDATVDGTSLREHTLDVRENVLTFSAVVP